MRAILRLRGLGLLLPWALGVPLMAVWFAAGWGPAHVVLAVDDLLELVYAMLAAAATGYAAYRARGRRRHSWTALTVGLVAWSVGEALWSYYQIREAGDEPFPSPADLGFLIFPVAAVVALWLFPAGREHESRARLLVDGVVVTGSAFVASWVLVLQPVLRAGADDAFAMAVSLAYPVTDLVLVSMALLIVSRARTTDRSALLLLAAGMVMMSAADSAFMYLSVIDPDGPASPWDAAWPAAFVLFAAAALQSRTAPETAEAAELAGPSAAESILLPYSTLALAVVVLGHQILTRDNSPALVVALGVGILVVGRQVMLHAENRRLVDALTQRAAELGHQARHDQLTGTLNRYGFDERLAALLDDPGPLPDRQALLLLDVDDFKGVNDRYGHLVGDAVLVTLTERVRGCLDDGDVFARLGGDEFAILTSGRPAPEVADRIMAALAEPFVVDGTLIPTGVSLGLAYVDADAGDAEALIHRCDQAMYRAKQDGKHRWRQAGTEHLSHSR